MAVNAYAPGLPDTAQKAALNDLQRFLPSVKNIGASSAGKIYLVNHLLGSASVISLVTGTNVNFDFVDGALYAEDPIPYGQTQVARVLEKNGDVEISYPIIVTGVTAGPTKPIMPPSWDKWTGANEIYGKLGNMRIDSGLPAGFQVGRVLALNHDVPSDTPSYALTGDSAGLVIEPTTGMISISNPAALTVGDKIVTITATNSLGSASTTIKIYVVGVVANVWYVDAIDGNDSNAGNLPSKPFKTAAVGGNRVGTVYWRRGRQWTDSMIYMYENGSHRAYGDPSVSRPWINAPAIYACAPRLIGGTYGTSIYGVTLEDMHFTGTQRCIHYNGDGTTNRDMSITVLRCRVSGNKPDANAKGMFFRNITRGPIRVRHCDISEGVEGDGVYILRCGDSTGRYVNEICYNTFGVPGDTGGGDNFQIANENDVTNNKNYDFWIHHNNFKHGSTSGSTKGNVVIENTYRYLFEYNECSGRFFCMSSISFNGTVRYNRFRGADLTDSGGALQIGESANYGKQRWVGNRIEKNLNGILIGGYSDPAGGWNRYDLEIFFNTFRYNNRMYKQNRPASGRFEYNVAELNTTNSLVREGNGLNVATGGTYTSYSVAPNYYNTAPGPVLDVPVLTGTPTVGQVLVMPTGFTKYFFMVNDIPVTDGSSRFYTIPDNLAPNANVPAVMSTPTLSVAMIKTDAAGNSSVVIAQWENGAKSATIAPAPVIPTVGVLMSGFEALNDWGSVGTYNFTLDSNVKVQGNSALRVDPTSGTGNTVIQKVFNNTTPASLGTIAYYTDVGDDYDWQTTATTTGSILINGGGTIYPFASRTGLYLASPEFATKTGGFWTSGLITQQAVIDAGAGNHAIRIATTPFANSPQCGTRAHDALYSNVGGVAGLLFRLDDGYTDATELQSIFESVFGTGVAKAQAFIPTNQVGTTNRMVPSDLVALQNAGWAISANGDPDDLAMTDTGTPATVIAKLATQKQQLIDWGLKPTNAFCYTFGGVRKNGTRIEKSSATVSNNVITPSDGSTTGITAGMRVICDGASKTVTVQSVTGTDVTLTENISKNGSAVKVSFVDASPPFHGNKLQTELKKNGWKWGLTTKSGYFFCQYGIAPDDAITMPCTSATGMTLSTFQPLIKGAIDGKSVVCIYIHRLQPSASGVSNNWARESVIECLQWLKQYIDNGQIRFVTTETLDRDYGRSTVPPAA